MTTTNAMKNDSTTDGMGDDVGSANLDFPHEVKDDIKEDGRFIFHAIASCYCFLMLAIMCEEYFLGSIEIICQSMFQVLPDTYKLRNLKF